MGTKTRSHSVRSILSALALVVGVAVAAVAVAPASSAVTAPAITKPVVARSAACSTIYWGSLVKARAGSTTSQITSVRSGQHPCYDRLVVDLNGGGRLGYDVRYVSRVRNQGAGAVVPVRGGAVIRIVVHAPAHPIASPRELAHVTGFAAMWQVADGGSFEGQTTIALGVRARLPMRVFVLGGPGTGQRLVVDVAHHW